LLKAFGPEKINIFIDNEWYIIGSIYYNLKELEPTWSKMNLSEEEKLKVEKIRRSDFLKRLVIPALERAQWLASKFPASMIEQKITPEWLMKKGDENRPIIAEVVRARGEKGQQWLERQAAEFVLYFTNRLIWHDGLRRMVLVESASQPTGDLPEAR